VLRIMFSLKSRGVLGLLFVGQAAGQGSPYGGFPSQTFVGGGYSGPAGTFAPAGTFVSSGYPANLNGMQPSNPYGNGIIEFVNPTAYGSQALPPGGNDIIDFFFPNAGNPNVVEEAVNPNVSCDSCGGDGFFDGCNSCACWGGPWCTAKVCQPESVTEPFCLANPPADLVQCALGCPDSYIDDGYCDEMCNVPGCDNDGKDCMGADPNGNSYVPDGGVYTTPDGGVFSPGYNFVAVQNDMASNDPYGGNPYGMEEAVNPYVPDGVVYTTSDGGVFSPGYNAGADPYNMAYNDPYGEYYGGAVEYAVNFVSGCAPGCDDRWLGDYFCDYACFVQECRFDRGDCDGIDVSPDGGVYGPAGTFVSDGYSGPPGTFAPPMTFVSGGYPDTGPFAMPDLGPTLLNCPVWATSANNLQPPSDEELLLICAEFKEEPACAKDVVAQSIIAPFCVPGFGFSPGYGGPGGPPPGYFGPGNGGPPGGGFVDNVAYVYVETPGIPCPEDGIKCPDGSNVVRDPDNNCQMPACPDEISSPCDTVRCGENAKCEVTRDGETNCVDMSGANPTVTQALTELLTSYDAPATTDEEFSICNGLNKRQCKNLDGCQYSSNKCGPDTCNGFSEKKCNKKSWCVYSNNLCEAGEVEAPSPCVGLKKKKCKKTDGCEYTDKCDDM